MATRGAKPKAVKLRLVDGTHRNSRHGDGQAAREAVEAAAAWKKFIEPAGWLDGSREPAAIAFCELWKEFMFNPTGFPASKHGQMRAYMSELGLTDERNRGDHGSKKEEDEFFGPE